MKKALLVCATLFALASGTSAAAPPSYHIFDLGGLGGRTMMATSINNKSDIVGTGRKTNDITDDGRPFLWQRGAILDLTTMGAPTYFVNPTINDSGLIGGTIVDGPRVGAVWSASGGLQTTGVLPGKTLSWVNHINNLGQAVGGSATEADTIGFIWDETNGIRGLGLVDGVTQGPASAINDHGLVGGSFSGGGSQVTGSAFLWDEATGFRILTPLHPSLAADGWVGDLNNDGIAVGASVVMTPVGGRPHATLWRADGTPVDLGVLPGAITSVPEAINANSVVVGYVQGTSTSDMRGFVWDDGMYDLNNLIPADSGWVIERPFDINDRGEIVGLGLYRGGVRSFLLIPVPEPSIYALMLAGIALVGFAAKRRMSMPH